MRPPHNDSRNRSVNRITAGDRNPRRGGRNLLARVDLVAGFRGPGFLFWGRGFVDVDLDVVVVLDADVVAVVCLYVVTL